MLRYCIRACLAHFFGLFRCHHEQNCNDRKTLPFHKMVLDGTLPLTLGGGIGQSRLSMLLLEKLHIGEVQASIWDENTHLACKQAGICLL